MSLEEKREFVKDIVGRINDKVDWAVESVLTKDLRKLGYRVPRSKWGDKEFCTIFNEAIKQIELREAKTEK